MGKSTTGFTHVGIIYGDARDPKRYKVKLRQTKLFWVSESGTKYRKNLGGAVGMGDWPMYSLDIDSITPTEETK